MKFTGMLRKRGFWIANFIDERNYDQFEIDNDTITAAVITNGRERIEKPVAHQMTA